jgi:hypothetical protein
VIEKGLNEMTGDGRYRYFDHPLPDTIAALRGSFYGRLAPIANEWSRRLRGDDVTSPPQGAFVIFPTHHRPSLGKNGYHRVGLRHGVSTLTSGSRTALGIIFHDAR